MPLGLFEILRASRPAAHKGRYSLTSKQAFKLKGNSTACMCTHLLLKQNEVPLI